jgi:hypothetical protein
MWTSSTPSHAHISFHNALQDQTLKRSEFVLSAALVKFSAGLRILFQSIEWSHHHTCHPETDEVQTFFGLLDVTF